MCIIKCKYLHKKRASSVGALIAYVHFVPCDCTRARECARVHSCGNVMMQRGCSAKNSEHLFVRRKEVGKKNQALKHPCMFAAPSLPPASGDIYSRPVPSRLPDAPSHYQ